MKKIFVTKRNGSREPYNVEKIQRQIEYACRDIDGVSQSMIELGMDIELFDGITTEDIDQLAINSAVNLINPENNGGNTNYQFVAGRLQNSVLRKKVYGKFDPPPLFDIVERGVNAGMLEPELLTGYSKEDWEYLETVIDHAKDETLTYSAIKQFIDKYLIRNRSTGEFFDTPQVRYMVASAATMMFEHRSQRLSLIKNYYQVTSDGQFTLPTPQLSGLGTRTRQFSSCVLIKSDDSMDSIFASGEMIAKYSGKRAGIGLDFGSLRSLNSPVRGGELAHTGLVPFIKKWQADLNCASQGGTRKGSMTANYPWFHKDFEDLIVLKNNRGTEETRVRHIDYAVAVNKFLFKRMQEGKTVTLFDPNEVPEVYEAFYRDQSEFERLYTEAENDPKIIRKKVIPAYDIVDHIITERSDTGRIYIMFVDNVINGTSFDTKVDPVYQTNLCAEISLATQPFQRLGDVGYTVIRFNGEEHKLKNDLLYSDENGIYWNLRNLTTGDYINSTDINGHWTHINSKVEVVEQTRPAIALCTLGSINWGKFNKPEQMRNACRSIVRGLDNILIFQDYLSTQSFLSTQDFRPLGVGITNLAYWHAKRGLKYGDPEALAEVARWMEHQSYYLIEASIELAAERGACDRYRFTKWALGEFPHERAPKTLDDIRTWTPELDWESLRERLLVHGIRHATLGAVAPVESSSVCVDSTNGIELPKELVSTKGSRGSMLIQVVPGYEKLKNKYQTMWELDDCEPYLKTAATISQFIDQSISTNTFYDPANYPEGKISKTVVMRNLINCMRWGMKTLYYNLTNKVGSKEQVEDLPVSAETNDEEICEACVL